MIFICYGADLKWIYAIKKIFRVDIFNQFGD